jgi:peptide/nickel transport system permease protein
LGATWVVAPLFLHRMRIRRTLPLALLAAIWLFAFAGPLVWRADPDSLDLAMMAAAPSAAHPLGTDESGRDVLARLMHGGRVSLLVGTGAMATAVVIGVIVGTFAGALAGWTDAALMRTTDALLAVPAVFIALTALSLFGPTVRNLILVIALTSWMGLARLVRGEVMVLRHELYVESARALGASPVSVLARHIVPQLVPTIAVGAMVGMASAMLTESALSFLGMGVQPPAASWGNMLSGAQTTLLTAPRLAIWPGVMIALAVAGCNALGGRARTTEAR